MSLFHARPSSLRRRSLLVAAAVVTALAVTPSTAYAGSAATTLSVASAEVGTLEGSSRQLSYWNAVGVTQTSGSVSWCAVFVSWVMSQSGGTSYRSASVGSWVGAAQMGNYGLSVTSSPAPGDLVAFDWDGNGDFAYPERHIGIYESAGSGSSFNTIEGNASDMVKRESRSTASSYSVLFIHVDYGITMPPSPSPIETDPAGPGMIGVVRQGTTGWDFYGKKPGDTTVTQSFGNWAAYGDVPTTGDWDGDGTDTLGVFRKSGTAWKLYGLNTNGSTYESASFGNWSSYGDEPTAGDWDGDGKDTLGVFRKATTAWQLFGQNPGGTTTSAAFGNWQTYGDEPTAGDWDGDGKDTIGVYRESGTAWRIYGSNPGGTTTSSPFGNWTSSYNDVPTHGDWDNDGTDTIGVFRHQGTAWEIFGLNANGSQIAESFGNWMVYGDQPVAGSW